MLKINKIHKIGFFVTLSIAVFIWGLNYLKGEDIFRKENEFCAIYNQVDGLSPSSPVMINGLQIGIVRSINFTPEHSGNLIVKFTVDDKFELPRTSMAHIYSMDIMGTKAIKIIMGKGPEKHQYGDTLLSAVEGDIKDQVSMQMLPLKYKAENLMKSLDSVLAVVRYIFNENTRDNLSKSFESIKSTIANLEQTSLTLDTLVASEKTKLEVIFSNIEQISSNLNNNSDKINRIVDNLSMFTDTLVASNITETIENTNQAVSNVKNVVEKINNGQGSLGLLLNDQKLYDNLNDASDNLNALIQDIEKNPKKYVHFSAIDLGKTVIVDQDGKKIGKKKKDKAPKQEKEKGN